VAATEGTRAVAREKPVKDVLRFLSRDSEKVVVVPVPLSYAVADHCGLAKNVAPEWIEGSALGYRCSDRTAKTPARGGDEAATKRKRKPSK